MYQCQQEMVSIDLSAAVLRLPRHVRRQPTRHGTSGARLGGSATRQRAAAKRSTRVAADDRYPGPVGRAALARPSCCRSRSKFHFGQVGVIEGSALSRQYMGSLRRRHRPGTSATYLSPSHHRTKPRARSDGIGWLGMAGCVIEWATVQVWPDLVLGEQLSPPRFGYGPEATISFTPTHGSTGDYLHANFGVPLTVSHTTYEPGFHHTSSLRSRGGFGCTPDGVVTDPSLHLSRPDQQAQTCASIGVASGDDGAAPPSSRMLAGNRTSVGARRIEGFNLRLNLVGTPTGTGSPSNTAVSAVQHPPRSPVRSSGIWLQFLRSRTVALLRA